MEICSMCGKTQLNKKSKNKHSELNKKSKKQALATQQQGSVT